MPTDAQVIQWFPGHMVASMRKMAERLTLVDVVIQVVDARLPQASGNPMLDELAAKLPRLIVLSREDLADAQFTVNWQTWYETRGLQTLAINGKRQGDVGKVRAALLALTGARKTARAMIVGTPNTGKSTLINGLLRRTAARVEDKAGVTRQLQWFRVAANFELMDTPGILVPKIANAQSQWMLSLCGALPRERYDPEEVITSFVAWAHVERPQLRVPSLEDFAAARGFKRHGSDLDLHNASGAYLKDFNDGKFGRITFETPPSTNSGQAYE